jgi:undecaprenyl-diphosphatase
MLNHMTTFDAVTLGIIEGLTEYLPISSTGHLIAASRFLGLEPTDFQKGFEIGIQSGAILSVLIVYWQRFFKNINFEFYKKLFFAFLPTAILGLLLKKHIDNWLESLTIVATTTLLGGIFLVWMERKNLFQKNARTIADLTLKDCMLLGVAQSCAMLPGTSRSGATIVGGLFLGLTKEQATEFSFFLAVPTLLGATVLKMRDVIPYLNADNAKIFGIGWFISFIVAIFAIKSFIKLVSTHGFTGFGIYRILFGLLLFWTIFK